MSDREPIDDALREQLVAYLDGELPGDEAEAIESRLATDESLREQVQGLDRAWNALDGLPQATVDDSFTKSTIEMVAIEAERNVATLTAMAPVRRRRLNLAAAGAFVGVTLLAFAFVRAAVTRPDRVLVADLPVIYRVDALQEVGGPEFLRELPEVAAPLLAAADGERLAEDLNEWRLLVDGDRQTRSQWVSELSDSEKAKLLDAARRYGTAMTQTRRAAVQETYEKITSADDRDALMRSVLAYETWLAAQPASDQSRLRQMSDDDRLAELKKIACDTARENRKSLSLADSVALRRAMQSLAGSEELTRFVDAAMQKVTEFEQHVSSGDGPAQAKQRERLLRMAGRFKKELSRQQRSPAWAITALAMVADGHGPMMWWQSRDERDAIRKQAKKDWKVVEKRLVEPLSPAGKEVVNVIDAGEDSRRRLVELVLRASRDATRSIDFEEFFASDELSDADRHELLGLPTDQMQERLRQMYVERVLGGDDAGPPEWMMRGGWGFGRFGRGGEDDDRGARGDRGGRDGNRRNDQRRGDRGPPPMGPPPIGPPPDDRGPPPDETPPPAEG